MPIYAYKCSACGHAQDVLQKISAAPLTDCPACGESAYSKQVTAPQFQLKGSGWYVTDFRGGASSGKDAKAEGKSEAANADAKPAAGSDTKSTGAPESAAATATPASSPAPAPAKPAAANE